MGLFGNKDPMVSIGVDSRGTVMPGTIENSSYKFLWYPTFSSKKSDSDTALVELKIDDLGDNFRTFMNEFLEKFNSQFPVGTESPRPKGDVVELSDWPNYTIGESSHPYWVLRDPDFTNNLGETLAENFHQKYFSMYVYTDSSSVGKFGMLHGRGSNSKFVDFFDFNVSLQDELGMSLWSICASSTSIKSALFLSVRFRAGESTFDKVMVGLPRRAKAAETGMILSKFKLKG